MACRKAVLGMVFFLLFFSSVFILPANTLFVLSQESQELIKTEFILLIDEAHSPLFGYKELIESLGTVNETLYNTEGISLKVCSNEQKFNSSSLIGVDILIIPPLNGTGVYTREEALAISRYIKTGGAVLLLSAPTITGAETNPDIAAMNQLIELLDIDIAFEFYYADGSGDFLRDNINGEGDILYIDTSEKYYISDDLRPLFDEVDGSIKISSGSLILRDEEKVEVIKTAPTAYRVKGNGEITYDATGYTIFALQKIELGIIATAAFGPSFTNLTSPSGNSWLTFTENMIFLANLIDYLLRLDRWSIEAIQPIGPIYIYFVVASLPLIAIYPYATKVERKKRKKIEEKRKEVKISEVLKKIREQEK